MEPLSILSATGTAIGITKNVAEILNTLISQTQNANRLLQQLHRELVDFEGVLKRMNHAFSDKQIRDAAFETQTGNIGAHWHAVLHAIFKCNDRLKELRDLLAKLAGTSRLTSTSLIKGARLNLASSDIQFYRDEFKDYKENIQLNLQMIVVCRVMDPRTAAEISQPDLITAENEIRRLKKEIKCLRASASASAQTLSPRTSITRKLIPPNTADTGASIVPIIADSSASCVEPPPTLSAATIRQRRLETADLLEPSYDSASTLVSSASTLYGGGDGVYAVYADTNADRLSIRDKFQLENVAHNPAIVRMLGHEGEDDQDAEAGASTLRGRAKTGRAEGSTKAALMLLPRFIASLLLFSGMLLAVGLAAVVLLFWLLVQVCTGFRRWGHDTAWIKRDSGMALDWFEERWRDIW